MPTLFLCFADKLTHTRCGHCAELAAARRRCRRRRRSYELMTRMTAPGRRRWMRCAPSSRCGCMTEACCDCSMPRACDTTTSA